MSERGWNVVSVLSAAVMFLIIIMISMCCVTIKPSSELISRANM